MNAIEILQRSIGYTPLPRLLNRRQFRAQLRDEIARWERHRSETGFTGEARVWTHEDGRELWEHRQPDGEWVPWP